MITEKEFKNLEDYLFKNKESLDDRTKLLLTMKLGYKISSTLTPGTPDHFRQEAINEAFRLCFIKEYGEEALFEALL